jgi:ribonuclease VapC
VDNAIFDASALLALLLGEPGGAGVEPLLLGGATSAVIACEVQTRLVDKGMPATEARTALNDLGLAIAPFAADDATAAAALRPATRKAGLSLGDRACLALAYRTGWPVYTADRPWTTLGLDLDIRLIR